MRFETAIAPSIHTAPSHMSLFTGLDPVSHGILNLGGGADAIPRLSAKLETLPERMRASGFHTACFTDHGNLNPKMDFDRGWVDAHFKLEPMSTKVNAVEDWMRRSARAAATGITWAPGKSWCACH
jgi:arylsulfatase A-like enzyme